MSQEQLSLFSVVEQQTTLKGVIAPSPALAIDQDSLQQWKQTIAHYQHQVRSIPPPIQGTLFDHPLTASRAIAPLVSQATTTHPESIDPFSLPQQNMQFWRRRYDDVGIAALYFVIDYELPLLLYVGETVKSNRRWQGEHGCKRYLDKYQQAHYQNALPTCLGIAFWPHAPMQTRPRQQVESALIRRWRSPFNKENWEMWGTPFVTEKYKV